MSITLIDRHGVVLIRSPVRSSSRALVAWPRFPGTLPSVIAALATPFLPATPFRPPVPGASTFDATFTEFRLGEQPRADPTPEMAPKQVQVLVLGTETVRFSETERRRRRFGVPARRVWAASRL